MRSTTWKTWWMLWAMKMQECPESRALRTKRRTPRVSATPRLLVGSSRMIRSLSKCIARAIATAWRSPPESELIGVVGGMSLVMPTFLRRSRGDLVHGRLIHAVEEARALDRLAAEEEVARDRKLRDQGRVLVDRLDAERDRVGGAADVDLAAADVDVAAGRRDRARQNLDQRRLAGAVVAEEPDDLALVDRQVDVLERLDAAVELGDVLHADEFFGHVAQVPAWCRRSSP